MLMKQKTRRRTLSFVAAALLATGLTGASASASNTDLISQDTQGQVMYSITNDQGELYRYGFDKNTLGRVGYLADKDGRIFTGIQASTILPGSHNIFAFWTDTETDEVRMLYVNPKDGKSMIVGDALGHGHFTGATVANIGEVVEGQPKEWAMFATQSVSATPGVTEKQITADIGINPSHSATNEFRLTTNENAVITRGHLHGCNVFSSTVFYEGPAVEVIVKPKGGGNSNSVLINGVSYPLSNSKTYRFKGQLEVKVSNPRLSSRGKAMGQWSISIKSTSIVQSFSIVKEIPNLQANDNGSWVQSEFGWTWEPDVKNTYDETEDTVLVSGPSPAEFKLLRIDPRQQVAPSEIMPLSREYDSLNTKDGINFTATSGNRFYKINAVDKTETPISQLRSSSMTGQAWCGDKYIAVFDRSRSKIVFSRNNDYANIDAWINLGWHHMGTIIFAKEVDDSGVLAISYD